MRDNQSLHDKAYTTVDLALKNIILSRVPAAFNNSFKIDEEAIQIEHKDGYYTFYIEYIPTNKIPANLKEYYIYVYVSTLDEKYHISLCDKEEGEQVLLEIVNTPDDLVGTYYKWVANEFDKLSDKP